jgi:1-acyl-sn-glycerol-3-phosphate acyltransferase
MNYYWRLMATGGFFTAFWAGCILYSTLVFPVIFLTAPGRERRRRWIKWVIHKSFALLVRLMEATGLMRLETAGIEQLRSARDVLVLANHPSYIDVVVLLSLMPNANCVVKGRLWDNPFLAAVVTAAGYIRNSVPEHLVADCARSLAGGDPLIVFPEGTRTRPDRPLKFLRGAAHIALQSDRPILPVLLHCDPPTLVKGARWHEIPSRPFCFRIVVRPPLRAAALADTRAGTPVMAARRLTMALEGYFSKELSAL